MNRVAQINDAFRKGILSTPEVNDPRGGVSVTQGVHALSPDVEMSILAKVRNYTTFDPEDDPYGEHDFGVIEMQGVPRIYWKIDYYEDASMQYGAEDKATAYRSLLILLADEY